ncbi:hypothetical protein [Burkholderia perseverans]|uniref:hypothetical protein n=1 Tax=Burkholderia perseverans TaxID=2615214 RepID=UPI001FEFDAFE|nr:hypothetical protein [Burkholderia perseverans]
MRHPAMRRARRNPRPEGGSDTRRTTPAGPAASRPERPDAPADGEHNQGGARPEGIDYQRDLGSEQDA